MKNNFKPPELGNGDLRTPVTFYEYVKKGPYPDDLEKSELHSCMAEAYSPSMKDREVLNVNETQYGLTIAIRDPLQSYTPNNKHSVEVEDFRLEKNLFNIYDVRFDKPERGFITVVLGEK
ncbi:hypothetical protein [Staphylococcus nepalensis]|uniref:hypothetical protein n=1 Tax=Staphylococcus nepalensis TaxID=214473 RepID=UPI0020CD52FF|nr:hypothetical protein [Staphylococcus nepalensis]